MSKHFRSLLGAKLNCRISFSFQFISRNSFPTNVLLIGITFILCNCVRLLSICLLHCIRKYIFSCNNFSGSSGLIWLWKIIVPNINNNSNSDSNKAENNVKTTSWSLKSDWKVMNDHHTHIWTRTICMNIMSIGKFLRSPTKKWLEKDGTNKKKKGTETKKDFMFVYSTNVRPFIRSDFFRIRTIRLLWWLRTGPCARSAQCTLFFISLLLYFIVFFSRLSLYSQFVKHFSSFLCRCVPCKAEGVY